MITKEIVGVLTIGLNAAISAFYIWQVKHRGLKPHVFTWIIWALLNLILFAATYAAHAGPGCWVLGTGVLICLYIAALGLTHGEKNITRSDWVAFIVALSAIPAWMATNDPLWAVVIVTGIDCFAYYPTFRKSWLNPREEGVIVFSAYTLQIFFSLFALESYSLTTLLNFCFTFVMNASLVLMILYRRRVLA